MTVSANEALSSGSSNTEDGWALSFTRFLVVLGDANLAGDNCDAYSESQAGEAQGRRKITLPLQFA